MELEYKKVIGKNAPPKLAICRPRGLPSIPSMSIAPPEDLALVDRSRKTFSKDEETYYKYINPQVMDGAREIGYLTILQKASNLNIGPGSYDPS